MLGLICSTIISVIMIFGGLSGRLAFRGTNSSTILVVAGVIYLVYDIYRIIKYKQDH